MFNRRKLFGFAAAAPVVAFLPNNEAKAEVKEDISHNAPSGSCNLQLQAQEIQPKHISFGNHDSISFNTYQPTGPILGISVGKDGHMWIKVNDKWKRVVTE
jgi:hypothetical protein